MIRRLKDTFVLETKNTTYCFRVMETGHLEHLYYGRKITLPEEALTGALVEKWAFPPGNTNTYCEDRKNFTLEDIRLEMSSYGKGDIREPLVEVIHGDGSYTSDFLFADAKMQKGKPAFAELPGSYDESGEVDWLCVTLRDAQYNLTME